MRVRHKTPVKDRSKSTNVKQSKSDVLKDDKSSGISLDLLAAYSRMQQKKPMMQLFVEATLIK